MLFILRPREAVGDGESAQGWGGCKKWSSLHLKVLLCLMEILDRRARSGGRRPAKPEAGPAPR